MISADQPAHLECRIIDASHVSRRIRPRSVCRSQPRSPGTALSLPPYSTRCSAVRRVRARAAPVCRLVRSRSGRNRGRRSGSVPRVVQAPSVREVAREPARLDLSSGTQPRAQAARQTTRRQRTEGTWDGSLADLLVDPCANPEQQLVEDRRGRRLRSVLAALPERDRQCLYLRAEGLRYREIAKTLDVSLGAVAKSLARAMTRLMNADES